MEELKDKKSEGLQGDWKQKADVESIIWYVKLGNDKARSGNKTQPLQTLGALLGWLVFLD